MSRLRNGAPLAGHAAGPGGSGLNGGIRPRVLALLDHQAVRFAMVGVVNALFGFGLFALLQIALGDRVHYLILLLVANIVAVVEAYVLQRWLVFLVRGRWWRGLARFSSVYLVALVVNMVALPLLVEIVLLPVLPAQAIVVVSTAMGTFFVHRGFTFRRPSATVDEASGRSNAPHPTSSPKVG